MDIVNETKIPDDIVRKFLESSLDAVRALPHWPQPVPVLKNCTVRRDGVNQGLSRTIRVLTADENWNESTRISGHYIDLLWPINHKNRCTYSAYAKDHAKDQSPDIQNVMEIFALCVHEFGHQIESLFDYPLDPYLYVITTKRYNPRKYVRQTHEIRVREYERKALFNMTPEQWSIIKDLATACETYGNPGKKKSKVKIPNLTYEYCIESIEKFHLEED